VLTFPFPWRPRLAQDGELLGRLTHIFADTVQALYVRRAAQEGTVGAKTGAVTVVQRASCIGQAARFDLLLGRRTYDIWSGFWPKAPSSPMADRLNAATKFIATQCLSLQAEPINQGDLRLRASGAQLRDALISKLAAQGSLPLPFYPDLARTDDPASGFLLTVYSPRFSTGYFPQRNRFTVLVETHSWKDYATRVRVTRNTIIGLVELVFLHGEQWLREAGEADRAAAHLGGVEMTLDYSSSWREPAKAGQAASQPDDASSRTIEFRGYAYTRDLSPISGDLMTVYDPKTPRIWRVPFRDRVEASLVVRAPRGGYVVPAEHAETVGMKLTLHGIAFEPMGQPPGKAQMEEFRIARAQFSPEPFEGRQRVALSGEWRVTQRDVPPGSLFVPISQPRSRLIMALLEPQAPDSLAAWGSFNACFEQKEQIEPYVAGLRQDAARSGASHRDTGRGVRPALCR